MIKGIYHTSITTTLFNHIAFPISIDGKMSENGLVADIADAFYGPLKLISDMTRDEIKEAGWVISDPPFRKDLFPNDLDFLLLPGETISLKINNLTLYAIPSFSKNDGWSILNKIGQSEFSKKVFDRLPGNYEDTVATVLFGNSISSIKKGADVTRLKRGLESTVRDVVLYKNPTRG